MEAEMEMEIEYEVQHYTLMDGWVNCWTVSIVDGQFQETTSKQTFKTEEDAQAELDEFFEDIALEILCGEREKDEGYDRSEFRIVKI